MRGIVGYVCLSLILSSGDGEENTAQKTGKQLHFHNGRHHQPLFFGETPPERLVEGQQAHFPGQQGNFPGQQSNFPGQQTNFPGQQSSFPGQQTNFPGQQGNQGGHRGNTNCRGHNKHRPECGGKNKCNKNPNHPHCVQPNNKPDVDPALDNALQQLSWLQDLKLEGNSILIPGLPETPTNTQQDQTTRNYQLAFGAQNIPFQECLTPFNQLGNCRFVQHCILPEFAHNFNMFLRYFCVIRGRYVGACCPHTLFPNQPRPTALTTLSTTTPRPPTRPTDRGCGINSIQQTKIVGGRPAPLNKYPWMAALLRNSATQYCGGVLVSEKHVLTAAHCVDGFDAGSITIRLGEYSFNEQGESPHKNFGVSRIRKHEHYSTTTYVNDLALITLDRSTAFSDTIWPVCLPPPRELFIGETATVVGWGTIYFGGPVSNILQEVSIPVWRNTDCDSAYTQDVFSENLCAGDKAGGKDSCQGDSGGPLLLEWGSRPRRWIVIGVVSWGIRCAEPDTPGVYARVNLFLDWINTNMA